MSEFGQLLDDSSFVAIEIDEGTPGASSYERAFGSAIRGIAATFSRSMEESQGDSQPDDLVLEFGLKALADGDVAVTSEISKSNFRVLMRWSSGGGAGTNEDLLNSVIQQRPTEF